MPIPQPSGSQDYPSPGAEMPKRVALVYGGGGQNIGNSFFYEGGKWILQQVFGENSVGLVQTQPAYWTFRDQRKGNPPNAFAFLANLDVDYLVLQGPLFTRTFRSIWAATLPRLRDRGTKLILLGAGFHRYDQEEVEIARNFLEEIHPLAIVTRDSVTYRALADWGVNCHNGIDSAFAVAHAYTPPVVHADGEYIALTFDRYPEPSLSLRIPALDPNEERPPGSRTGRFQFGGQDWYYTQPRLSRWFAGQGKWQAYLGARLDRRSLPPSIGPYTAIRPDHRYNPHVSWKIYQAPNGLVSDEPFTFCAVYAGAALTLTDRVHACVATLAYGNPAMLFTPSPRSALFDRVGLDDIRKRPVTLSSALRDELLVEEIGFLTKSLL